LDLKLMVRVLRYSRRRFLLHLHSRSVRARQPEEDARGDRRDRDGRKETAKEAAEGRVQSAGSPPTPSVYVLRSAGDKTREIFINSSAANRRAGRRLGARIKLTCERGYRKGLRLSRIYSLPCVFSAFSARTSAHAHLEINNEKQERERERERRGNHVSSLD